jgi:hypothetical protein
VQNALKACPQRNLVYIFLTPLLKSFYSSGRAEDAFLPFLTALASGEVAETATTASAATAATVATAATQTHRSCENQTCQSERFYLQT